MRAILLLVISLASLMGAQLEPVSTIDFAGSLHVKENSKRMSIWMLSASPEGPMVAGGGSQETSRIAHSDRAGSSFAAFELRVPYGGGESIAPLPDRSFWFMTRSGPVSCDFYTSNGHYVKSFRIIAAASAGARPPDFPVNLAASADEIAVVYPGFIRAGHIASGNFVVDREWRVNGSHLVFPFGNGNFVSINRLSGEFAILDPGTPDTRTIATPFKFPNRRYRFPVTAANGCIWFFVPGASPDTGDLFQLASDGSMVSRNTLRLEKGVKPLRIAISGRDVYVAGISATVYRYELPQ